MDDDCKDLISIVIPVYNVVMCLDRCMKSIFRQTYMNLEIILVDDGSTDGSSVLCDRYAAIDTRVRVIHQANKGLSAARNAGTIVSKGKYICYVDSDDEVDMYFVELLYEAMIQHKASLVICENLQINEDNHTTVVGYPFERAVNSLESSFVINEEEYLQNFLERKRSSVAAWNRMYTAELAHHVFFPEGRVYEDMATHVRFAVQAKRIAIVCKPLYHYYKRKGSITNKITEDVLSDHCWAYQRAYQDIIEYNPKLSSKAEWLVTEIPISTLTHIYANLKTNDQVIVNRAYIKLLKKQVQQYLLHGVYKRKKTFVKALVVLFFPRIAPSIVYRWSIIKESYRVRNLLC